MEIVAREDLEKIRDALDAFVTNKSFDYDTVTRITEGLKEARDLVREILAQEN